MENIEFLEEFDPDMSEVHKMAENDENDRIKNPVNRKRKRINFTSSEKKTLAALVKRHEGIWNLQDPLHQDINGIRKAWKEIAESLKRTVSECKTAWGSLRDSRRYHTKVAKQKKSGSACEGILEHPCFEDDEAQDWEFSQDLSFLPDNTKKRNTFSTSTNEMGTEDTVGECSNYSYMSSGSRPSKESKAAESATKLSESIEKLVKLRRENNEGNADKLVHGTMLANLDRMLQKLPDETVEELNVRFVNIIYEKIKEIQK